MFVTRRSRFTGIVRTLDLPITEEQVAAYNSGVSIQKAFSNLSKGDLEFIISGVPQSEWDELIGAEEDDISNPLPVIRA